jgi:methyl-accepting chemotaxis protein
MRPIPLATLGLLIGLAFPAGGALLGAGGPVLWLLGAVPALLAPLGWVLGVQAATIEERRGEAQRAARARRDEAERTSADLAQRAKGLVEAVASLTASTEETAAGVRDTSGTMSRLSTTATASALTAETVVGLALESERAAARGLSTAEQSHEALTRLATEVQALSQLIAGLNERMRDAFQVADAVAQVAERSRSLSAMAKAQAHADGGVLAPEAFPALVARMDGHAEDTAAAAARAKGILDEIRVAMAGAVVAAEASSVRAGEGAMVIEGAASTLRELARALATSARAGREIAAVAQQQESGFEQVMHSMNGIFLAYERTSASTREVAGEARAIGEIAGRLKRAVRPES